MRLRYLGWLLVGACGHVADVGDHKCTTDTDCPATWACVRVTQVHAVTGDCLTSSGVEVCRPHCTSCPPASACGCVCP
jgi:hypothetical protein